MGNGRFDMEKIARCIKCQQYRPQTEFVLGKRQNYTNRCKTCVALYLKNYRTANKDKTREYGKRSWAKDKAKISQRRRERYLLNPAYYNSRSNARKKLRKIEARNLLETLKDFPCFDCGTKYPKGVMDFDHRDPSKKTLGVGRMVQESYSLKTIASEAAKCDLVCCNCHRIRTFVKSGKLVPDGMLNENQQFVRNLKSNTPCKVCNNQYHFCAMDFDHIEKDQKSFTISGTYGSAKLKPLLVAEIEKCQILCANCHRLITNGYLSR